LLFVCLLYAVEIASSDSASLATKASRTRHI
jgi:hypothetical protein